MSKTNPEAGAAAAQRGYDYQLSVSVFAALRLLLVTKSASYVTLEPANEEDLEADLDPNQTGRVVPSATLSSGYKLVIQVKFRAGEPWALKDIEGLLDHGLRRRPAKDHLNDLNTRFLLITSGGVKGQARNLMVGDFEEQSDAKDFPPSLRKTLTKSPQGRIAIWSDLSETLIDHEIRDILGDLLKVPKANQEKCREDLAREGKRRMRGQNPGRWSREDLLRVIRAHGGYLASAAELETFVPPANFEHILKAFRERHAVVIKGPSGTGKTLAAIALRDRARKDDGDVQIIHVKLPLAWA